MRDRTNLTKTPLNLKATKHSVKSAPARADTPAAVPSKAKRVQVRKAALFSVSDTTEKDSSGNNSSRNYSGPNLAVFRKPAPASRKTYGKYQAVERIITVENVEPAEILRDYPTKESTELDLSGSFSETKANKESTRIEDSADENGDEEQVSDGQVPVLSPIYKETPKTHENKTPEWRMVHGGDNGALDMESDEVDESIVANAIRRSNAELMEELTDSEEDVEKEEHRIVEHSTSEKKVTFRDTISEQSASQPGDSFDLENIDPTKRRQAKKTPPPPNTTPVSPILRRNHETEFASGVSKVVVSLEKEAERIRSGTKTADAETQTAPDTQGDIDPTEECLCKMFQAMMKETVRKTNLEFYKELSDQLRQEINM